MNSIDEAQQAELFAAPASGVDDTTLVLYALGDFQSRGKMLAERELPLDRLRGAMKRAAEEFGCPELTDENFADVLKTLGAHVRRVPTFVAKHPFRVVVPGDLAEQSRLAHQQRSAKE